MISNLVLIASSKKSGPILAQVLLVLLSLAYLSAAGAKEQASVWHFRYMGQQSMLRDVLIAPNAIKFTNSSSNTLISKAPKWDACLFNDRSKKIFHIPFSKWDKSGLGVLEAEVDPVTPDQLVNEHAKVLGLPAVQYLSNTTVVDGFYRMRNAPRKATNAFFGTNAISVGDIQKRLFCLWFGLPLSKEFPLIWSQSFANGETTYDLKILSFAREPYNPHAFDEPVNYTLAHDTREVYMRLIPNAIKGILNDERSGSR